MRTVTFPVYLKITIVIFLLCLLGFILNIGQDIILPLAFSLLLSILLLPVASFLERKKLPRVLAIAIALLTGIAVIAGVLYFITTQIVSFTADIASIKSNLAVHFQNVQNWVNKSFNITQTEQNQFISKAGEKLKETGTSVAGQTFSSLSQLFSYLVLIPIYSFLLLYYRDLLKNFIVKLCTDQHKERVDEIMHHSKLVIQSYMTGLLIELFIVAAINSAGFLIIGIKYAIFLGLFAAIMNLIPYIGMLIAAVFCMLITLTNSQSMGDVIWVGAVLTAVQFIDNNIIMPNIVSSKVKINALVSILGVLAGGALAGISGMFLSIPFIAISKVIFDRVDSLKPWGMLLSDTITGAKVSKLRLKILKQQEKDEVKEEANINT